MWFCASTFAPLMSSTLMMAVCPRRAAAWMAKSRRPSTSATSALAVTSADTNSDISTSRAHTSNLCNTTAKCDTHTHAVG